MTTKRVRAHLDVELIVPQNADEAYVKDLVGSFLGTGADARDRLAQINDLSAGRDILDNDADAKASLPRLFSPSDVARMMKSAFAAGHELALNAATNPPETAAAEWETSNVRDSMLEAFADQADRGAPVRCEIRDIEMDPALQNYTVTFFIDGDRSVEYFSEQVVAANSSEAWDLAVEQAAESGCSSSGYSLDEDDFAKATEISTMRGHRLDAHAVAQDWEPKRLPINPVTGQGPCPGDPLFLNDSGNTITLTVVDVLDELHNDLPQVRADNGRVYTVASIDDDWHTIWENLQFRPQEAA